MDKNTYVIIKRYISEIGNTLEELPIDNIARIIDVLNRTRSVGKKVFIFGNGGSAATASHFACDLSKGAISKKKPRIRAITLTDNTPLLSAWANDTSYENIFAEQLENLIESGDTAIGISVSGNSQNVLNGIKLAKAKGATTIGFIGFNECKLEKMVDIGIIVPTYNVEQVEDIHLLLMHVITTCLRGGS